MKKSITTIILGIILISLAFFTYKTFLSFYLGIYGFIAILDTTFFLKEYYNKTTYIIIVTVVVLGMSILYFSPLFPHNMIIHSNYIVNGLSTLSINILVIGTLLLILLLIGSILKLEKYKKALDLYNKSLKLDSENPKVLYSKGLALLELEEYNKAIKIFSKILKSHPENTKILYSKGLALAEIEEYDNALEIFNRLLKLDPENINAIYCKLFILKILNRNEEALRYRDEAVALDEKILEYCLEENPFKSWKENKNDRQNYICNRNKNSPK
ncbi:tetratricopeptide repeat protein [Methanobacterium spitsbergense]|uniref:Tetratricopeptide repeat protein n=1 Tax=Methanobacterium spitsbergense TaxID=2874285 RepID=A0A8T5UYQ7_9EURY|nr:tetratricopeptide repeat protein [Methanobacterium spitsbergense]MBZ2165859.1 tetratricopeptide repeat protein [Methanobacterium spitsbergense]